MVITTQEIIVGVAAIIAVLGVIIFIRNANQSDFDKILKASREDLLKFFLYAEKQDWVNEEKMEWCLNEILKLIPNKLNIEVDPQLVKDVAQYVYNESKEFIKEVLDVEEEAKASIVEEPQE